MIELNFSNVFQIHVDENNDVVEFAIRKSFFDHKINWFKRVITIAYIITIVFVENQLSTIVIDQSIIYVVIFLSITQIFDLSTLDTTIVSITIFLVFVVVASKIILDNDVIIHKFNDIVVQIFKFLIEKYLDLWKKFDFVELSKKNWMKISLKIDWKSRIFDKIKIYSLDIKNKKLVNFTFD